MFKFARIRCNRPCHNHHVIVEKQKFWQTTPITIKIDPPPEAMFSASCVHWNLKVSYWICQQPTVFITYPLHCFAKVEASKTNKKKHNQITTDRFTKQPQTENINISLYHWQIHIKQKENEEFQGALQEPPRNLPGTSRPLSGPFLTLCPQKHPQGPPKTLWRHQISLIS